VGLQTQTAFIGKIDEALTQQQREVQNLQQTLVDKTQIYQQYLVEQKKFEAVIKRQESRAQKQEAKRDQKMNDEFAARIHRQNHA
jgi:flagellar FliJ protein